MTFSKVKQTELLEHFPDLDPNDLNATSFEAGQEIYEVGDEICGLWHVAPVEGSPADALVRVTLAPEDNGPMTTAYEVEGDMFFGELELFAGGDAGVAATRISNAVALTDVKLTFVDLESTTATFEKNPTLRLKLAELSARRSHDGLRRLARLMTSDVEEKLESVLLDTAMLQGVFSGPRVRLVTSEEKREKKDGVEGELIKVTRDMKPADFKRLATQNLGEAVSDRSKDNTLNAWDAIGLVEKDPIVIEDIERLRLRVDYTRLSRQEAHAKTTIGVQNLVARGEFQRALVVAQDFVDRFPSSPMITYYGALAAARLGASREAERLLRRAQLWVSPSHNDDGAPLTAIEQRIAWGLANPTLDPSSFSVERNEEVFDISPDTHRFAIDCLALPARLRKDAAFQEKDPIKRRVILAEAADGYAAAYRTAPKDSFLGVNVASLNRMAGNAEQSALVAKQVFALVENCNDLWSHATRIEALLLMSNVKKAAVEAASFDSREIGHIASLRLQLSRLVDQGVEDAKQVLDALPRQRPMVFAGPLMLDRAAQVEVSEFSAAAIKENATQIAYGALARGADIIAAEAALEAGCDLHVVLPWDEKTFRSKSVSDDNGSDVWSRRFDACLKAARSVQVGPSVKHGAKEDPAWIKAGWRQAAGRATLHAMALQTEPFMLATIRKWEEIGTGHGTANALGAWRKAGRVDQTLEIDVKVPDGRQNAPDLPDPFRCVALVVGPKKTKKDKDEAPRSAFQDRAALREALEIERLASKAEIVEFKWPRANGDFAVAKSTTAETLAWAETAAERLNAVAPGARVVCSYGPVADPKDPTRLSPKRLGELTEGEIVRDAELNRVYLTASFVAEHVLTLPVNELSRSGEQFLPYRRHIIRQERVRPGFETVADVYVSRIVY